MEPPRDGPVLTPVGGSSKLPVRLGALLVALIVIALLKPWGWAPNSVLPSASPPGPVAEATATTPGIGASPGQARAAPTPSPDPDAIECLEPDGWRIVTLQRSGLRESRSWTVVRPTVASGPGDPAIGAVRLSGLDLIEIGFCGEGQRAGLAPAEIASVWMLAADGTWQRLPVSQVAFPGSGGGGYALMTAEVSAAAGAPASSPAAGRSGPAATATFATGALSPTRPTWRPGRYVFSVTTGGAASEPFWFGAEIIAPPPDLPVTSPPVSPRPTR